MLFDERLDVCRKKQVIGNRRNALRLTPRRLEISQLALESPKLGFLVQGHLDAKPNRCREGPDWAVAKPSSSYFSERRRNNPLHRPGVLDRGDSLADG